MRTISLRAAGVLAVVLIVSGAAHAQVDTERTDSVLAPSSCRELQPALACTDAACTVCGECEGCLADVCGEPLWTLTADAIFLHRSDPSSYLLFENTASPTQRLDAENFDFGVHTGVDLTLTRRLGWRNAIEARYFGVDQWSADANVATTPGDLLRLNTAVPVFVVAGTGISARYTSELHNFEINGLHDVNDWFTLLAGFRYLELDEHLRATLVDAIAPFSYDSVTRNRLYGFQLGGRIKLWESCCCDESCCCTCGRLTIDGMGKAGIYGNQPARRGTLSTSRSLGAGPCPCRFHSSLPVSPRAAFVGELGVTATYRLWNGLSVRGGYRLLWLDGMALASDQPAVTAFLPPALAPRPAINTSGDVFYDGAFVGLQYQW